MLERNNRISRRRRAAFAASILALLAPLSVYAASGDAAARFGARKAVEHISLSPDGSRLVSVQALAGRSSGVLVTDLSGSGAIQPKALFATSGDPDRLQWCRWAGDKHIICAVYLTGRAAGGGVGALSRLIAMDSDGGHRQVIPVPTGAGETLGQALSGGTVLDWSPGAAGHIVMTRVYMPEKSVGTRLAMTEDGLGVDNLDLATMKTRTVERPDPDAISYIADATGAVQIVARRVSLSTGVVQTTGRVRSGRNYDTGEVRFSYRKPGDRDWHELSTAKARDGFRPYGFDTDARSVIGLKKLGGRMAAYRKALDGSGAETLLFARDDVDVEGFLRLGPRDRIVGVSYVTDKQQTLYFDPDLKTLAEALARGMPQRPLIRFLDESEDGKRLLIWAGSDIEPGRYYLYDRATRHLDELMLDRPPLAGQTLSSVKTVSFPAVDGVAIPAYLTLPPSGRSTGKALVMPHGGPGVRDQWGFDWMAQFYAAEGYVVLQPNYRGSAGYGDDWLAGNGFRDWRTAVGDVTDAGKWLVAQKLATPGRLGVVGWSYGGYAALQSAVIAPGLFGAVVAIAPITDFEQLKEEYRYSSNYLVLSDFIGSGQDEEEGSPARHADRIAAPVLLFHGALDGTIDIAESRLMDRRLKGAGKSSQLVTYDGLDHALDDSDARTDLLKRSLQFLDAHLAGTP